MELFKKENSKFYWYDFTVAGKRYRGSTKEGNENRATKIAALKLSQALEGKDPLPRRSPILLEFSGRFLEWVKTSKLEQKTKLYYQNGWRLLEGVPINGMRLDKITAEDIDGLQFDGSPSNVNCALRTLSRMLHKASEWRLIQSVPKCKLMKESGRTLSLNDEVEKRLLAGAAACKWTVRSRALFRDIVIAMRDTGMRNERELYRIRIENLDWDNKVITVPDSKTLDGRRLVPMSERVLNLLVARCGTRREGWVFASKKSKSGHLTTNAKHFRAARSKAGLPDNLVLYCARHDYGSRILKQTGNLAAVMRTMGHRDVKTAMRYQHPDLETVRLALNKSAVAPVGVS